MNSNFFKLILIKSILINFSLLCMQSIENFDIPAKLQQKLDNAYKRDHDFKACVDAQEVCKCPADLPCYVKPLNINRIENYTYLKNILEQNKLDEIVLPQKFLWQNKSTLRTHIVAEELRPLRFNGQCSLANLPLKQFYQLLILGKNGVWDFAGANKKFLCTNVFLTNDRNSAYWERNNQASTTNTASKIAIIDTKRIEQNQPTENLPAHLLGIMGTSYDKCVMNKNFFSEFLTLSKNPSLSLVKEFWTKWESCFKV